MLSRLLLIALLAGCGSEEQAASQGGAAPVPAAGETPAAAGTNGEAETPAVDTDAAYQQALHGTLTHLDLVAIAHMADVDHHGLFLDFGTAARAKYTNGSWRSGWGTDVHGDAGSFTRMGEAARVWVPVGTGGAYTLRMRLRKVGTSSLVVYLNGETVRTVDISDGLHTYDVTLPAEQLHRGENQIRLRATSTTSVGGQDVSVEMDWMRLIAGTPPAEESYEPPTLSQLVERGDGGPALRVRGPTTLSWHLEVPPGGKLALGIRGSGQAHVTLTPADGEPAELWETAAAERPARKVVDLAPFVGKVVRLDLALSGEGEAHWLAPAVVIPMPTRQPPSQHARNVIVLTIDTLRADKLRVYNPRSRVRTPVLDSFAEHAVIFDNAQAPENWTKPSVASILTSLMPMTHRTKDEAASLPDRALMLSEVFQDAGFTTGMFCANGYVSDRFGFKQGWDFYTNYIRENKSTTARNVYDEAMHWVEENRERRFFLYIQTIDPHVPYDPPDEFLRMYDDSDYDGQVHPRMTAQLLADAKRNPPRVTFTAADVRRLTALHDGEISYHDVHLGRFLEKLQELGLWDDLIFVVVSDHGEEFGDHEKWGHGHSVFQELLHVPLMVRWPALGEGQSRVTDTVSTMDIGPTVLEASGVDIPEAFEGRSLMPWLLGHRRTGPAVAFSEFLDDRRVIRAGRYKLILRSNQSSVMFDLQDDPGEQRPLLPRDANPIGLRYTRVLQGQLLGADDRRDWLHAEGSGPNRALPQQESEIDPELCRQLGALGYADARCQPN